MPLEEEFVERRITQLNPRQQQAGKEPHYILDLRLCELPTIEYDFEWLTDDTFKPLPSVARSTQKPSAISKLDVSLNQLFLLNNSAVSPFRNLRNIDASLNRIGRVDISSVGETLTSLNLSHNCMNDISFISYLPRLVHLNLAMNEFTSITRTPSHVSLQILNLSDNKLRSLEGIQALPYLKELQVQRNELEDILPVSSNQRLTCLNASNNSIYTMDMTLNGLQQLPIRSLLLFGNPIEKKNNDYYSKLNSIPTLLSLDNVTLNKRNVPASQTQSLELSNPDEIVGDFGSGSFRQAAGQMFWNQLAVRKDQMEENVKYLQSKITQHQNQYKDFEDRLRTDMETTIRHLEPGSDLPVPPNNYRVIKQTDTTESDLPFHPSTYKSDLPTHLSYKSHLPHDSVYKSDLPYEPSSYNPNLTSNNYKLYSTLSDLPYDPRPRARNFTTTDLYPIPKLTGNDSYLTRRGAYAGNVGMEPHFLAPNIKYKDVYSHIRYLQDADERIPPRKLKPEQAKVSTRVKGQYKGVNNTDEVLRLASLELLTGKR